MRGHGAYKGPDAALTDQGALVDTEGAPFGMIRVQFDNERLGSLAWCWHLFPAADFDIVFACEAE